MTTLPSLPKIVTDAAIPRHVNASMLTCADGSRVYFVAGSEDGNWSSRGFATATAFASFLRRSYPVVQA